MGIERGAHSIKEMKVFLDMLCFLTKFCILIGLLLLVLQLFQTEKN